MWNSRPTMLNLAPLWWNQGMNVPLRVMVWTILLTLRASANARIPSGPISSSETWRNSRLRHFKLLHSNLESTSISWILCWILPPCSVGVNLPAALSSQCPNGSSPPDPKKKIKKSHPQKKENAQGNMRENIDRCLNQTHHQRAGKTATHLSVDLHSGRV